jgi:uncharacterized protein (DUF1778 family)
MPQTRRKKSTRSSRIDLRATRDEERLIRLGAQRRGESFTRFIVNSACNEAQVALADQKHFSLSASKFDEFVAALDRPAKIIPALQKLFSEPSILERRPKSPAR